ncbi:MAG TPA: tetratricopeptide repeat protein [Terriglobales bacterium]|nr:tetratricopeptide repeat protein [Terriglobales bacterium]
MRKPALEPITSRPPVVIALLVLLALVGLFCVGRLVHHFQQEEKALARQLYWRSLREQVAGKEDLAIQHFRAALSYDRDNFEYQLALARALVDSGRTQEAESYLIGLWERFPQNGEVNLALGRLAAKEKSLDRAIQYYHNAIYGLWVSDAEQNRVQAWFELIRVLIGLGARQQAEAELLSLSANVPPNAEMELRTANLFAEVQDYEHALTEYRRALGSDPTNAAALAGAGEAAYKLSRYRTAAGYLEAAAKARPQDAQLTQLLRTSQLVLENDPFNRRISRVERDRRLRKIFQDAGQRLDACIEAGAPQTSNSPTSSDLMSPLKGRWTKMKSKLGLLGTSRESDLPDEIMDLVLQIEQQTTACGMTAKDQALLLLAENRAGVEQ